MFGRVQHGNSHGGGGGGKVCSFYQQGRCKFGDNCKFDHPGANRSQDGGNRFQALENQGNNFGQGNRNNQRPSAPGRGQQYTSQNSYGVTRDGIESDLRGEKPQWPFSAYGPGRDAPIQLFGGFPIEQSPEEMRVLYYQAVANGNPEPAMQAQQELIAQTTQQVERILNDLDGAVKYVLDGENQHPNRTDGCQAAVGNVFHKGRKLNSKFSPNATAQATSQPVQTSAFGQPSSMGGGGAFGQPSNLGGGGGFGQASSLGQRPSPFGQPASTAPTTGAFGSPSALGQKPSFGQPAAGFGQPSVLGASTGGFGQPSTLGSRGAFGQPAGGSQASPFSQTPQANQAQSSPFAQAPQQGGTFGQTSAFGQTSTFGQQSNNTFGQSGFSQQPQPAFGQPSAPAPQNAAFGQPSAPAQTTAFGQPSAPAQQTAFGQPSAPGQQTPAFGKPSTPAFGQPSAPTPQNGVFGRPSAPSQQQTGFGKPSPFAQAQENQQQSPFAQAAARPTAFGQPSQPVDKQTFGGGFGTAAAPPQQQPQQQQQQQPPQSFAEPIPQGDWITRQPNGTLKSFKGAPVQYQATKETVPTQEPYYRKANGQMERIWHPEGIPAPRAEIEAPAEAYTAEHEAAYKFVAEQGVFKDGIMPELPPKCDWIRWDI